MTGILFGLRDASGRSLLVSGTTIVSPPTSTSTSTALGTTLGVPGLSSSSASTTPAPSGYTALSGITYDQTDAYSTAWNAGGDNWKVIGLEFFPVGGTGPFTFSLQNAGGWNITDDTGGRRKSTAAKGWAVVPDPPIANASSITLVVTDALGTTVSRTVSIPSSTATGPAIIVGNNRTWPSNITPSIMAYRTDGSGNNTPITSVTDPAGIWVADGYTAITTANGQPAPAGTYTITVNASGGLSRTVTFTITQAVMGGVVIVNRASVVSTSVLRGWKAFQAIGTTPGNSAVYTIGSTSSKYIMGSSSGICTVLNAGNLAAGTDSIVVTQTEGNVSTTYTVLVPVQQGTTLDDSHMALTLDKPFTNYFFQAATVQRNVATNPPTLTGFPSGTSVSWYVSKLQRFNWTMDNPFEASLLDYDTDMRGGVGYPRFGCNPTTGMPFVQAQLSDTTGTAGEWFELTATTGLVTCTKRFYLQVTPVIGPKIYVGPNAAPSGFTKVATLAAALAPFNHYGNVDISSVAGTEIRIEYDPSNPNRYVNDWEQNYYTARADYSGPFTLTFVQGPNNEVVYYGGGRGSSNANRGDKALICMNDGDLTINGPVDFGDIHMGVFGGNYVPGSNQTMSLVRRNGGCSGDIRLTNVDLHDADVPLENGNCDGQWILKNVRIYNGSGCTSGGGANQHNAYLGMCWNVVADNVLSYNCADGHTFKLRSAFSTWTNSRFYDAERGSGFNAMDLPCGGTHSFSHCHFEKGPAAQNPYMIQFGEEIPGALPFTLPTQDYIHALSFDQCTFTNHATAPIWATGDRGPGAISFIGRIAPNTGVAATLAITNSVFEGYAANTVVVFASNLDPGHDFSQNYTQSGNTFPSTFTPLNFTNPVGYGPARPGWHNSVADLNGGRNFPFFNAVQIDPGVDEIRIPANSPAGTLVCTLKGYGADNWSLSSNAQPDPRIAPFVAGTQWSAGQTLAAYTGQSFGYANSKYVFNTLSNGTGEVRVGSSGLGPAGLDVILPRGTSPSSTGTVIVENPLFVVKTP